MVCQIAKYVIFLVTNYYIPHVDQDIVSFKGPKDTGIQAGLYLCYHKQETSSHLFETYLVPFRVHPECMKVANCCIDSLRSQP